MQYDFTPDLITTGIGSVPFTDPDEAVSYICNAETGIPFWPQLPKRSFIEKMIPQYSEEMPCVITDPEKGSIVIDASNRPDELAQFYEKYLEDDPSLFPLSPEAAQGFYSFEKHGKGKTWPWVKGHVTGPVTFTTGIFNEQKQPLFADPELRDAAVKLIGRNAQWQISRLKRFASEGVIIFVDEPVLAAYGTSSYMYLSEQIVTDMLNEIFICISEMDAIAGIHVCGNSDWSMVAGTDVSILSFDAYQYGSTISLYPEQINALLERGGCIAWGIVPTTQDIRGAETGPLVQRLSACIQSLHDKGIPADLIRHRSLLTPSCGTGSLTEEEAHKAFSLLRDIYLEVKSTV